MIVQGKYIGRKCQELASIVRGIYICLFPEILYPVTTSCSRRRANPRRVPPASGHITLAHPAPFTPSRLVIHHQSTSASTVINSMMPSAVRIRIEDTETYAVLSILLR